MKYLLAFLILALVVSSSSFFQDLSKAVVKDSLKRNMLTYVEPKKIGYSQEVSHASHSGNGQSAYTAALKTATSITKKFSEAAVHYSAKSGIAVGRSLKQVDYSALFEKSGKYLSKFFDLAKQILKFIFKCIKKAVNFVGSKFGVKGKGKKSVECEAAMESEQSVSPAERKQLEEADEKVDESFKDITENLDAQFVAPEPYVNNLLNDENFDAFVHGKLIKQYSEKTGYSINQKYFGFCESGNVEMIRRVLLSGAEVDADNGRCLIQASINGHRDVVVLLLENGADVKLRKSTAFRAAYRKKHTEIVKVFREHRQQNKSHFGRLLANERLRKFLLKLFFQDAKKINTEKYK